MVDAFNLNRMIYFIAVVEEGSMTAAAERLRISKAVVSKQILHLEDELGTALLVRNTRNLSPTEAGERFYEHSKAAVEQANAAFRMARDGNDTPRGNLRITASLDYGTLHLAPVVAAYVQRYPEVTVDLHLDDGKIDLVGKRFDLSFRTGWLEDSSNLVQKVGRFEEWVVGSPSLDAARIVQPEDLARLPAVEHAALKQGAQWVFSRGERRQTPALSVAVRLNSSPAIRQLVESGRCIAVLPDFLVSEAVGAGRLQRLLPDWTLRSGGIYAVTPRARFKPLATRRFVEMVVAYHRGGFGGGPGQARPAALRPDPQ